MSFASLSKTKTLESLSTIDSKRNESNYITKRLRPFNFQHELKVSQPGDVYEQEADQLADQIIRMPDKTVQRKYKSCRMKEDEVKISRKASVAGMEVSDDAASAMEAMRGGGVPLDQSTRNTMESNFGFDFGNVRIHTDERAASSAESVSALAYAMGNDIVFGQGQYQPNTSEGKRLIAHELSHVMQQSAYPKQDFIQRQHTGGHISIPDPPS